MSNRGEALPPSDGGAGPKRGAAAAARVRAVGHPLARFISAPLERVCESLSHYSAATSNAQICALCAHRACKRAAGPYKDIGLYKAARSRLHGTSATHAYECEAQPMRGSANGVRLS